MGREELRKRRRRKRVLQLYMKMACFFLIVILAGILGMRIYQRGPWNNKYIERTGKEIDEMRPEIQMELLTENPYSRPGIATERIRGIVVHDVANPGSTAMQNRNYFEGLKDSHLTEASSHFIVGLEGEIVQCVPTKEVAYASNKRNKDTISIETCHWTEDGTYTEETYESLVELTSWLCKKFDLTEKDIIRHYDITAKICPKYFVENEEAWKQFKEDVRERL